VKHLALILILLAGCTAPSPMFPAAMIYAMTGPTSRCLKWFSLENARSQPGSVAWRNGGAQWGDGAKAAEYRSDLVADQVWFTCWLCPFHRAWDRDGDGDVDLEDYNRFVIRWSE
jgi:hypothetical protein